jgi:hypothetical protein
MLYVFKIGFTSVRLLVSEGRMWNSPAYFPEFITGEILFEYKIDSANKFDMLYVFKIGFTSVRLLVSEGRMRNPFNPYTANVENKVSF